SSMRARVTLSALAGAGLAAFGLSIFGGASLAARTQAPTDSVRQSATAPDSALWLAMRNVNLHIDDEHVMQVRDLRGQVTAVRAGTIPFLDDPESFRIRVTSGTVDLTGDGLAALLNSYVFAYKGSPLRNMRARVEASTVVISGIMHKGVDLPFEMTSELSLEPDGRIRSHPRQMKILGVDGAALLHAFGMR